jgi:hypothetical protein
MFATDPALHERVLDFRAGTLTRPRTDVSGRKVGPSHREFRLADPAFLIAAIHMRWSR